MSLERKYVFNKVDGQLITTLGDRPETLVATVELPAGYDDRDRDTAARDLAVIARKANAYDGLVTALSELVKCARAVGYQHSKLVRNSDPVLADLVAEIKATDQTLASARSLTGPEATFLIEDTLLAGGMSGLKALQKHWIGHDDVDAQWTSKDLAAHLAGYVDEVVAQTNGVRTDLTSPTYEMDCGTRGYREYVRKAGVPSYKAQAVERVYEAREAGGRGGVEDLHRKWFGDESDLSAQEIAEMSEQELVDQLIGYVENVATDERAEQLVRLADEPMPDPPEQPKGVVR
jgi:hypothetical protein